MKIRIFINLIFLSFLSFSLKGQSTYIEKISLSISSIDLYRTLTGEIASGDIVVNGIEGDSISMEAEVYNAPGKNYTCNQDECMIVDQNFFHFSVKPREGEKIKKLVFHVPSYTSINIKILGSGSVSIHKIFGEIQINTIRVGNINLKEVRGPLSIFGTYGDINVDFIKGISKKPMAISLLKGNIQISIPKDERVTFASLCPDENSTLKDYPVRTIISSNQKKDTSDNNVKLLEKRKIIINAPYTERIESREFFGAGSNKSKLLRHKKRYNIKEDVWVYDINGGGSNIELKVYQGLIKIRGSN